MITPAIIIFLLFFEAIAGDNDIVIAVISSFDYISSKAYAH
jgi:hypothetical protein